MKNLLIILALAFIMPAFAEEPKTKRVCKDVVDKQGKASKQCKTIKVHKKQEGTKVPEKAPKK